MESVCFCLSLVGPVYKFLFKVEVTFSYDRNIFLEISGSVFLQKKLLSKAEQDLKMMGYYKHSKQFQSSYDHR